jgi:hypothetical protein
MGTGDAVLVGSGWDGLSAGAADLKAIWAVAEKDLCVSEPGGPADVFLWEHSKRVVKAIPHILKVLGIGHEEVDCVALFAAALYHDGGWVVQAREGTISRWDILSRPTSDLQRDLGAGLAEERLAGMLSPTCLETAGAAIRGMNLRKADLPEAIILAEADNLDETGPMAFWQMVRQKASKGKGIEACTEAWYSRQEYHFWEARLARFRYDVVRELAERRLRALDQFIETVSSLSQGEDLIKMAGGAQT